MKAEYLKKIEDLVKLRVLPPFKTSNDHHDIECLICDEKFRATPKAKLRRFKLHGMAGCPKCTNKERYKDDTARILKQLKNMGFELLEEYKGNKHDHLVRNVNCCGREFTARPNNILTGATVCRPCNDERKREAFQQFNMDRHEESLKYKEPLDAYTKRVRVLTEATYREHKDLINPLNYPRLRAGQEDGYHLDHIRSISECFHNNVPPEECAHYTNLQMLPWADNISKGGNNRK